MTKLRKIFIGLLSVCCAVTASAGIAACADKSADYPDYKNPTVGIVPPDQFSGKYNISVQSAGGLPLSGVRVTAMKNGAAVADGTAISIDGKAQLELPADDYTLSFENLPEGYYLPEEPFTLSADNANVTVALPSKVISSSAANTVYSAGTVVHDFRFVNNLGEELILSELLETYRAVALNFWYIGCNPCLAEFPAIQEAYEAYSDVISLIAVSTSDTNDEITKFKNSTDTKYTFHMGANTANLSSLFDISSTPTTVVIDRFGVYAYRSTGNETNSSFWKRLFSRYAADDYSQVIENNDTEGDGTEITERKKPDASLVTPSTTQIENSIVSNDSYTKGKITNFAPETSENDAEYSWPWVLGTDGAYVGLYASNSKGGYTYAIIYCDVSLEVGDSIYADYKTDTEAGQDILYTLVNRNAIKEHSGKQDWKTERIYVANKKQTVSLSFCYIKDQQVDEGDDIAMIKNLRVVPLSDNGEATDIRRDAAETVVGNRYQDYVDIVAPDASKGELYYQVVKKDGKKAILYADITGVPTPWSELHIKSDRFTHPDDGTIYASLYYYSYYYMRTGADSALTFKYLDKSGNETTRYGSLIIENYYMQMFSDNGLIPVTPELREAIEAFVRQFHKMKLSDETGYQAYDNEWLEFCYYYDHYGLNDKEHKCSIDSDPVKGLSNANAFTAQLGDNLADIYRQQNSGDSGVRFKFTAEQAGAYAIYSTNTSSEVDPFVILRNGNGEIIEAQDDDNDYDKVTRIAGTANPYANFRVYIYLKAGESCYVQCRMRMPGATGKYNFTVERLGDTADVLLVCTTEAGMGTTDSNNRYIYCAIDIMQDDKGNWYADENGKKGSPVYVDFVHANYYDSNNHSLYEMIYDMDYFNLSKFGAPDYTPIMKKYYEKSIANKDESDPFYGLIEADRDLARLLQQRVELELEQYNKGWLMFACYVRHLGPEN